MQTVSCSVTTSSARTHLFADPLLGGWGGGRYPSISITGGLAACCEEQTREGSAAPGMGTPSHRAAVGRLGRLGSGGQQVLVAISALPVLGTFAALPRQDHVGSTRNLKREQHLQVLKIIQGSQI